MAGHHRRAVGVAFQIGFANSTSSVYFYAAGDELRCTMRSWRDHRRLLLPREGRAKVHPWIQRCDRVHPGRSDIQHNILSRTLVGERETR